MPLDRIENSARWWHNLLFFPPNFFTFFLEFVSPLTYSSRSARPPILLQSQCSAWGELQTAQNAALRTSLGCVKMSREDHLHTESKCMPVKDHNEMLSKQFFLSTRRPNHINHSEINTAPPRLNETFTSRFATSVRPLLEDNIVLDDLSYKDAWNTSTPSPWAGPSSSRAPIRSWGPSPPGQFKGKNPPKKERLDPS